MTRKLVASCLLAVCLTALSAGEAVAGPVPLPLQAELDLAQTVVVGKITGAVCNGDAQQATAEVTVSEVLKGPKADKILIKIAIEVPPGAASAQRVYRGDEEGIWIIMSDRRPSQAYGLLGKERLAEVKALLAALEARTWSDEVNGLRAWAGAIRDERLDPRPCVVFAVRNVSPSALWLPRSTYPGVVTATLRDAAGEEKEIKPPVDKQYLSFRGATCCRELESGQTCYLHPVGENCGYLRIPENLPAGKYTVTVTLTHTAGEGFAAGPRRKSEPVNAWKGKVTAPSFALEIPEPPPAPAPTPAVAPPTPPAPPAPAATDVPPTWPAPPALQP